MRLVLFHIFLIFLSIGYAQDSLVILDGDTLLFSELKAESMDTISNDSATLVLGDSATFVHEDSLKFSKLDSVIDMAMNYQGVRYRYGGMNFEGMDCSGLVCAAYEHVNIRLPHSSTTLSKMGEAIEADRLEKGDLIFFKGRNSSSVGHVAIVTRIVDGLIYIVHATSSRGVIEEVLQDNSYFMKRWLFNRRIN